MRSTPSSVRGWIGEALPRVEDERFLKGEAEYVGDMKLPEMLHAAFVRSGECGIEIAGPEAQSEEDVVGRLVVERRCGLRVARVDERGQFLHLDRHPLGGVGGLLGCVRDDERDRLSDVANAVAGQHRV